MYTYWIETRYPDGTTNYNCGDYETIEETMEQIEAMRDNETLNEFGIDYIVRQDTETQECIEIEITDCIR